MISNTSGVETKHLVVQWLYQADDIVLFTENDNDLAEMHSISDAFALKWRLNFNDKKSKFLVIGRKMSNKKWLLGSKLLEEMKSYNQIGVPFNHCLKDNTLHQ